MTQGQPDSVSLQEHPQGASRGPAGSVGTPLGEEQKVSWLELFFDLIFVVAFDQLARRLGDSPSLGNLGMFGLLFTAVWWAWAGNTVFAARYGNEHRTYRWGTLAQLLALSMIAMTLRGDAEDTGAAFALAFGVSRLVQSAVYAITARQNSEGRGLARRMASLFAASGGLWLVSAAWPAGGAAQVGLWGLALALEILGPLWPRAGTHEALPHEGHLPERVGLLQIIALGAIVTEVVNGSRQQALTLPTLVPAFSAILTVVALWRLYFDQARALPLLGAHLEGQVSRMTRWLYGHLPFTLSVVMLGVGLGHGISAVEAKKDAIHQQLVAWPLAGALLSLAFLRWNSRRVAHRAPFDRSLMALLGGAGLAAGVARLDLDTLQLHVFIAALSVTLAAVVATDPATRSLGRLEEKVTEQLEEGEAPGSLTEVRPD